MTRELIHIILVASLTVFYSSQQLIFITMQERHSLLTVVRKYFKMIVCEKLS